ncbi:hypothetical protein HanHA89_Chr15g0628161 [Helianthus annuus]|nr:hypothetical protein HanHA89_Chr15g0628161 [Helianthus annuus]
MDIHTDSDIENSYLKFSDIRNSDIRITGYPILNTPSISHRRGRN